MRLQNKSKLFHSTPLVNHSESVNLWIEWKLTNFNKKFLWKFKYNFKTVCSFHLILVGQLDFLCEEQAGVKRLLLNRQNLLSKTKVICWWSLIPLSMILNKFINSGRFGDIWKGIISQCCNNNMSKHNSCSLGNSFHKSYLIKLQNDNFSKFFIRHIG